MRSPLFVAAAMFLAACSIEVRSGLAPATTPQFSAAVTSQAQLPIDTPVANRPALTGKVLYSTGTELRQNLMVLDLATGSSQIVFQPTVDAQITAAALSPDEQQLVLAYTPPASGGQGQYYSYADLFLLPAECLTQSPPCDDTRLTPLLIRPDTFASYYTPVWSPDGRWLYFGHFTFSRQADNTPVFSYAIERMEMPDGQLTVLVQDALWPRLSADGAKLAYLDVLSNRLMVSDADGMNPASVLPTADLSTVDAPLFSPDGQWLYFSAVPVQATPAFSWLDRALGVRVAEAHNQPSDWWRLSLQDRQLQQVTHLAAIGLYGDFTADGQLLIFGSSTGLFVMEPDGAGLTQLQTIQSIGTVDWMP